MGSSINIFENIIKSIYLLKNKQLAYYILKSIDRVIQNTDNYDKMSSVYIGYVFINKYKTIENNIENLIRDLYVEDKRTHWKFTYLTLIDKFLKTDNPEIINTLLISIYGFLSEIHSIEKEDIADFTLDLLDLYLHSKNKWIGKIPSSILHNIYFTENINKKIILFLYLCILLEDKEDGYFKPTYKFLLILLSKITDKKEIYPKIFYLIQFFKNPLYFKKIFRKLRKYYNDKYDRLEPSDLQQNLNMANSFYRQYNFNLADFYFNRSKGIARTPKDSNLKAHEISKILTSNREIQREEFFKDLFLEYLVVLEKSSYSSFKIESFKNIVLEILATENIKYLYYIEKFLFDHKEEIELIKIYRNSLSNYIIDKKENQIFFSLYLRSFLLGSIDKTIIIEHIKILIIILGNYGYCKESIEVYELSQTFFHSKTSS